MNCVSGANAFGRCTHQVECLLKVEDFPLSIFLKGVALAMAPSVCRKSRSGDQREASLRREAWHGA